MNLQPSEDSLFSHDVVFENSVGYIPYNTDKIYAGTLEGSKKLIYFLSFHI